MLFKRDQAGSSLIETMIALFVLAVGLLGFAALMTNSLTMNQRAFTLTQAMNLANNLTERMRMNRGEAASYGITLTEESPTAVATDCTAVSCSAAELAAWDQKQWFDLLEANLPGGDAEVRVTVAGEDIQVQMDIHYQLRVGRTGSGNAASQTQMNNILQLLSIYNLRTEL